MKLKENYKVIIINRYIQNINLWMKLKLYKNRCGYIDFKLSQNT